MLLINGQKSLLSRLVVLRTTATTLLQLKLRRSLGALHHRIKNSKARSCSLTWPLASTSMSVKARRKIAKLPEGFEPKTFDRTCVMIWHFFCIYPFYPISFSWSFSLSFPRRLASGLELGSQVGSTTDHSTNCGLSDTMKTQWGLDRPEVMKWHLSHCHSPRYCHHSWP